MIHSEHETRVACLLALISHVVIILMQKTNYYLSHQECKAVVLKFYRVIYITKGARHSSQIFLLSRLSADGNALCAATVISYVYSIYSKVDLRDLVNLSCIQYAFAASNIKLLTVLICIRVFPASCKPPPRHCH